MSVHYQVYIGAIPEPIGIGDTEEQAIADALSELHRQGLIDPDGWPAYPDEKAALEAMRIVKPTAKASSGVSTKTAAT